MKKHNMLSILLLIFIALANSAFAITDAEKGAFIGAVDDGVDFDNFKPSIEEVAKRAEVKQMATWAQEEPLQFNEFLKGKGNQYIWTVRLAVKKDFSSGSVEDAVINDFDATNKNAENDKDFYNELKSKDFSFVFENQTLRISDGKIFGLGKKYSDAEIFNFISENFLSDKFADCMEIIRKSNQSSDILFKACQKIERIFFAKRKTDESVKANWEAFQNDANEIFMSYYKEQKLKSLNK